MGFRREDGGDLTKGGGGGVVRGRERKRNEEKENEFRGYTV